MAGGEITCPRPRRVGETHQTLHTPHPKAPGFAGPGAGEATAERGRFMAAFSSEHPHPQRVPDWQRIFASLR